MGRISQLQPRLVLMVAGPGWGKTYIARRLIATASLPSYCDLRDVLNEREAERLLEEACSIGGAAPDLLVVDELSSLDRVGWAPMRGFLRGLDPGTRLVLLAQRRPPFDFSGFAAPHETLTLDRGDLAFTEEECVELFHEGGVDGASARAVYAAASGWPVSTLVLLRLAQEGRLAEGLRDPAGPLFADVHYYLKARVYDRLPRETVDALVALAALGDPTREDLRALVAEDAPDALDALIEEGVPYVVFDGLRYGIGRFTRAALRAKYERGVRNVRRAAAAYFMNARSFGRAARCALEAGLWETAIAALEAFVVEKPPIEELARVPIDLVPFEVLLGSPPLLTWYLNAEALRADPGALLARVHETRMLPLRADPVAAYGYEVANFVALRIANHTDEASGAARRLKEMDVPPNAGSLHGLFHAELAAFAASLGLFTEAAEELQRADNAGMPFPVYQLVVDFHAYCYEGLPEELLARVEEGVRGARGLADRFALHFALSYRAIALFFARGREEFLQACRDAVEVDPHARTLRRLDDPEPERGAYPFFLDVLYSIATAFESNDATVAGALLDDVVRVVDRTRKPFWRVLARTARAEVPGADRAALMDESLALAQGTQAPRFLADVEALHDGQPARGTLARMRAMADESPLLRGARQLRVSIVEGVVARADGTLPVRAREFEILAFLALAGGPVSVEEICDDVWPQADADAAISALRMSIHRLRKQLGDAGAIEHVRQGYRVSGTITCDIVEAEQLVAACKRLEKLGAYERARLRELFAVLAAPAMSVSSRFAWYERIEARLAGIRHSLGVVLGRDALENRDPAAAIEYAEALLKVDAYDEPAVELLVRGLDAAGERAEAVRRYRQYADRLRVDYGVEASVKLHELVS